MKVSGKSRMKISLNTKICRELKKIEQKKRLLHMILKNEGLRQAEQFAYLQTLLQKR